jgi:hypothetical protein
MTQKASALSRRRPVVGRSTQQQPRPQHAPTAQQAAAIAPGAVAKAAEEANAQPTIVSLTIRSMTISFD